ncbi:MAG: hypothetical protein SH820_04965 [Xanthomonadales bacterium]|nr:hypothetical protein [Xanthomonadales bacterium]
MNSYSGSSAPKWFTIFAILALLWNLLGVMAFVMQATMSPEALAALPEAEQALYNNYPTWALVAFGVAVFGGALGSLLLALKKNVAGPVLLISLIGVLLQTGHSFFGAKAYEVYGPSSLIMPIMVVVIAIYLVMLAAKAKNNGWTN